MRVNKTFFVAADRYLEQFLYAHRVYFTRQYYEKGFTHWVYPVTERTLDILREYMLLPEKEGGAA